MAGGVVSQARCVRSRRAIRSRQAALAIEAKRTRSARGAPLRLALIAADTGGYAKAEVTVGGVDTAALSSKTMECRTVPGLYFIGEVVDVTGWLGGYNFQWAWASGHAAGEVI